MNSLYIPASEIFDALEKSLSMGIITHQRYMLLKQEYEELMKEKVWQYNEKNSTSCSNITFNHIMDACDYIVLSSSSHALPLRFDKSNLHELYIKGYNLLKERADKLSVQYRKLLHLPINFHNEWYQRVLYEQLPKYLKILHSHRSEFYFHHCEDDLNYPLIDGIPLFHDMYQLSGIELVEEYVRRLSLEQSFCVLFSNQLPHISKSFETCKGVSLETININLFEILCHQWFACLLLNTHKSLILSKKDLCTLKNILLSPHARQQAIKRLQEHLSLHYEIYNYIIAYEDVFQLEWNKFIKYDYELFITENDKTACIYLEHQASSQQRFTYHLALLQDFTEIQAKIQYIKNNIHNLYDLIDLLEHDLFYNEEYDVFFETLLPIEIAALIKLNIPDADAFHSCTTLKLLLDEFDASIPWQFSFISFLSTLDKMKQRQIAVMISKLMI